MKGDSSLLEPNNTFLTGDDAMLHDQATKTSTPKRYDAAYDADVSSALFKSIEVTSVTLGSTDTSSAETVSSTTDTSGATADPSWHGVVDISADYDPSQAREELSESDYSVRKKPLTIIKYLPLTIIKYLPMNEKLNSPMR